MVTVVLYSSEVQQRMLATAVLGCHPHTHQAALFDHEQGRAHSLHPEGQCSVDQTWTELILTAEHSADLQTPEP